MKKILVINFGSTSSKMAVFEDETQTAEKTINYTRDELTNFPKMTDQLPLRRQGVLDWLSEIGTKASDFDAISVRGGVTQPLEPGAYKVNQEMVDRLTNAPLLDHPSNMTPMVAWELTKEYGVPSYIYDPIFDHMLPVAKITGIPEIKRTHMGHIENMRAVSLKMAKELGKPVTECNFIVAHLGGGITMCCEENGRFVDFNDSSNSPFSPERAGVIPARQFAKLIYSGKYTEAEITKLITGKGGAKGSRGFGAPGKLSGGESSAENGRQPGRSRCKGRPARYFGSPRRAVESDFPELAPGFLSFRKKMDCCFCSAELSYGGPVMNRSCQNILR